MTSPYLDTKKYLEELKQRTDIYNREKPQIDAFMEHLFQKLKPEMKPETANDMESIKRIILSDLNSYKNKTRNANINTNILLSRLEQNDELLNFYTFGIDFLNNFVSTLRGVDNDSFLLYWDLYKNKLLSKNIPVPESEKQPETVNQLMITQALGQPKQTETEQTSTEQTEPKVEEPTASQSKRMQQTYAKRLQKKYESDRKQKIMEGIENEDTNIFNNIKKNDLITLKSDQLKKLAKMKNIKVTTKSTKGDLINELEKFI